MPEFGRDEAQGFFITRSQEAEQLKYLLGYPNASLGRVGTREQVAQGAAPAQGEPDAPTMLRPVVEQMAPLAERLDVAVPAAAVPWVMIEMRRGQDDLGRSARLLLGRGRAGDCSVVDAGMTD